MTASQNATPAPSGSAEETRKLLVEAATKEFAAEGVHGASLLEITRQAGQRNRGAVHYHFGSRVGILVAVLEEYADFVVARETELFTLARARPSHDLASCLEAIVRPAVELSALGTLGRSYLVILAELADQGRDAHPPEVVKVLTRIGGFEIYDLIVERMPAMPEAFSTERVSLIAAFLLKTVADRARAAGPRPSLAQGSQLRPQLPTEPFIANLIAMGVAMATAPVPNL